MHTSTLLWCILVIGAKFVSGWRAPISNPNWQDSIKQPLGLTTLSGAVTKEQEAQAHWFYEAYYSTRTSQVLGGRKFTPLPSPVPAHKLLAIFTFKVGVGCVETYLSVEGTSRIDDRIPCWVFKDRSDGENEDRNNQAAGTVATFLHKHAETIKKWTMRDINPLHIICSVVKMGDKDTTVEDMDEYFLIQLFAPA